MRVKVVSLEKCNSPPCTTAVVKEAAKEMGIPINLEHVVAGTDKEVKIIAILAPQQHKSVAGILALA